jgi:hypothetical protein
LGISKTKINDSKKDYLAIPIEAYLCEVVIRKTRILTELEKLTLRFIHKDNSLKNILNAFNTDTLVMNNILTHLFYKELIQLDLNQVLVYLNEKIIPFVESNTLDNYVEEESIDEKRSYIIIQEKIMGEIFIGSEMGDYTKNPGAEFTNYFDLTANPPNSYVSIKGYSLTKYSKLIRKDLRADPKDIVKINWLKPIHITSLYIPLIEINNKRQINIDYEFVPRRIQKAWQYAYEREFEAQKEESLDFSSELPYFLSNKNHIINFLKELILYTENIKKANREDDQIGLKNLFRDLYEDLEIYTNLLKEKIYSINDFEFFMDKTQFINNIKDSLMKATQFIIISSPLLDYKGVSSFLPFLREILQRKINVILIYGKINNETKEEDKELIMQNVKQSIADLSQEEQNNLFLIQSRNFNNASFILIDFHTLLFNNSDYLCQDYENLEVNFPTIVIKGGNIPFKFLEFSFDLLPYDFKLKDEFEKILINSEDYLEKNLNSRRVDFVLSLNNELKKLKSIYWTSVDTVIEIIEALKRQIKDIEKIETISTINDFEHNGILIDAMRELRKDYLLITDIIDRDQIGPNFKKHIGNISNFSLVVNKKYSRMEESALNIALSKLDNLKENYPQFQYNITEGNFILNILGVKDGVIIYTNERFFSQTTLSLRPRSSSIGLIINSPRVNSIIDSLKLY